jgi:hypothetical protein
VNKIVAELKKIVRFKKTTEVGDHVLIVSKNPQAIVYALVVAIDRDLGRKDEWWVVSMQLLGLPPQPVSWTLRKPQFTGKEIFTMQGVEHFIQAVDLGGRDGLQPSTGKEPAAVKKSGKKPNTMRVVK